MKFISIFLQVMIFSPVFAAPTFAPMKQQDWQKNSFLDAIIKGDISLLKNRIRARLDGPFSEFAKEFAYFTDKGETIFHALAKVKTNQKEFSEVLKELISVASFNRGEGIIHIMSLAGVDIYPKNNLEHTPVGRAIMERDLQKVNQKMNDIFVTGSAIEALSYLHGQMGMVSNTLRLLAQPAKENKFSPADALIDDLDNLNEKDGFIALKRYLTHPYLERDFSGRLPRQTAEQTGNITAFDVLRRVPNDDFGKEQTLTVATIGAIIGGLFTLTKVSVSGLEPVSEFLFRASITGVGGAASFALSAALAYPCYYVFKRSSIKLRSEGANPNVFQKAIQSIQK